MPLKYFTPTLDKEPYFTPTLDKEPKKPSRYPARANFLVMNYTRFNKRLC